MLILFALDGFVSFPIIPSKNVMVILQEMLHAALKMIQLAAAAQNLSCNVTLTVM